MKKFQSREEEENDLRIPCFLENLVIQKQPSERLFKASQQAFKTIMTTTTTTTMHKNTWKFRMQETSFIYGCAKQKGQIQSDVNVFD